MCYLSKQKDRLLPVFSVWLSKGFEAERPRWGTTDRAAGGGYSEPLELKRSNFLGEETNEAERKFAHREIKSRIEAKE